MAALCRARLLVAFVPFRRWRDGLGGASAIPDGEANADCVAEGRRLARQVDWAATRLPFPTKCLPRAMALSWMLRSRGIRHLLVFAARPSAKRRSEDAIHAWVEIAGTKVIGDLPGPWLVMLQLGENAAEPPHTNGR
jgi:hypothetical protein